jgi:hypothetical protein
MVSNKMVSDILAVFDRQNAWMAILAAIITWFSPAVELLLLLYGLTVLDWMLDVHMFIKNKECRKELWPTVTRPTIEKLALYSAFALAVHATQLHLIKSGFDIYRILMITPIAAELLSITKSVEANTGIQLVTRVQDVINGFFSGLVGKAKEDEGEGTSK